MSVVSEVLGGEVVHIEHDMVSAKREITQQKVWAVSGRKKRGRRSKQAVPHHQKLDHLIQGQPRLLRGSDELEPVHRLFVVELAAVRSEESSPAVS